ncbi:MAG: SiaB family protein kinase [Flavobacteriales bacterium]|nr:SiaB family protein kinase [Flavobacteriales bacterium]
MSINYSESVEAFCQTKCDSIKDDFTSLPGSELILANCGNLSEDSVDSILYFIEDKMEKEGEPKNLIKRIFTIVVESLQNIRIHGTDDRDGIKASFIVIGKDNSGYQIWVGNLAANAIVADIKSGISKIKDLKPNAIRKIYLNSLSYGKLTEKGGAGLGLITIALKSDNKLQFGFDKINENLTLFNLNVKVSAN